MREIGVTFDYLCPFARNAHESVVAALRKGRDLDVRFVPFSLNQAHMEEGNLPVWKRDRETWGSGVTALLYGLAIRDHHPDNFLDFHLAAFGLRHDQGRQLDEAGLDEVAAAAGVPLDELHVQVWNGEPLAVLEREHTEAVERWSVFGVPTFISGEEAVFIRFMQRGNVDDLDRGLDLLDQAGINEFKRTRIPR